ncbi:hypothetical protein CKAH01_10816 [Colletotrichum kahawae]|uniref:Uncharacterized protein n=1 Tax=Colletotrichum kahawae TaxID=34407 RepID=A0AAD9XXH2_COLKA|nr:hypothetical protein CKAH01_10816 [Colletotrichum kahawae]
MAHAVANRMLVHEGIRPLFHLGAAAAQTQLMDEQERRNWLRRGKNTHTFRIPKYATVPARTSDHERQELTEARRRKARHGKARQGQAWTLSPGHQQ